ncbi:hypothetical protein FGO68_gene11979 [Halteria grandinella]|uniref:Uncharacterized protein n=1 Tax=Halteria grandinella TaxID=5974 RepID=A0A8J8TA34_HALGN|nr:hypothetical protein FGO68_gene11979 [Halteria grandinella]
MHAQEFNICNKNQQSCQSCSIKSIRLLDQKQFMPRILKSSTQVSSCTQQLIFRNMHKYYWQKQYNKFPDYLGEDIFQCYNCNNIVKKNTAGMHLQRQASDTVPEGLVQFQRNSDQRFISFNPSSDSNNQIKSCKIQALPIPEQFDLSKDPNLYTQSKEANKELNIVQEETEIKGNTDTNNEHNRSNDILSSPGDRELSSLPKKGHQPNLLQPLLEQRLNKNLEARLPINPIGYDCVEHSFQNLSILPMPYKALLHYWSEGATNNSFQNPREVKKFARISYARLQNAFYQNLIRFDQGHPIQSNQETRWIQTMLPKLTNIIEKAKGEIREGRRRRHEKMVQSQTTLNQMTEDIQITTEKSIGGIQLPASIEIIRWNQINRNFMRNAEIQGMYMDLGVFSGLSSLPMQKYIYELAVQQALRESLTEIWDTNMMLQIGSLSGLPHHDDQAKSIMDGFIEKYIAGEMQSSTNSDLSNFVYPRKSADYQKRPSSFVFDKDDSLSENRKRVDQFIDEVTKSIPDINVHLQEFRHHHFPNNQNYIPLKEGSTVPMFHSYQSNEGSDYLKFFNYHIEGHQLQDDQSIGRIVPKFNYHNATNMKTTDEADVDSSLHQENYLCESTYKRPCTVFLNRPLSIDQAQDFDTLPPSSGLCQIKEPNYQREVMPPPLTKEVAQHSRKSKRQQKEAEKREEANLNYEIYEDSSYSIDISTTDSCIFDMIVNRIIKSFQKKGDKEKVSPRGDVRMKSYIRIMKGFFNSSIMLHAFFKKHHSNSQRDWFTAADILAKQIIDEIQPFERRAYFDVQNVAECILALGMNKDAAEYVRSDVRGGKMVDSTNRRLKNKSDTYKEAWHKNEERLLPPRVQNFNQFYDLMENMTDRYNTTVLKIFQSTPETYLLLKSFTAKLLKVIEERSHLFNYYPVTQAQIGQEDVNPNEEEKRDVCNCKGHQVLIINECQCHLKQDEESLSLMANEEINIEAPLDSKLYSKIKARKSKQSQNKGHILLHSDDNKVDITPEEFEAQQMHFNTLYETASHMQLSFELCLDRERSIQDGCVEEPCNVGSMDADERIKLTLSVENRDIKNALQKLKWISVPQTYRMRKTKEIFKIVKESNKKGFPSNSIESATPGSLTYAEFNSLQQ